MLRLWMLALGHFTNDFFVSIVPPLLPFLVSEFGITVAQGAALTTAITAGSGLLQPVFGAWIDRSDRTWLLPLMILWVGVLVASFGLLNSYWSLLAVALLAGLGSAVFHPLATVSIRAVLGRYSAGALSVFSIGGTAGMAVVPLVVVALVSASGMRGLLWLLIPTLLVVAVLYSQGLHRLSLAASRGEGTDAERVGGGQAAIRPGEADEAPSALARSTGEARPAFAESTKSSAPMAPRAGTRPLIFLSFATLIRTVGQTALTSFLPLYAVFKGLSETTGGVWLSLHLVAGSVAAMVAGYLSDRWGRKPVFVYSSILATPAFLLFLFTEGPWQVVALLIVSFFFFATFSVAPIYAQEIMPERPGMGAGIMMGAVWSLAAFLIIPLGTLADKFDLHVPLFVAAWLPLVATVLMWWVPETRRVQDGGSEAGLGAEESEAAIG